VFFYDIADLMQAAITQIWEHYPDAVSFYALFVLGLLMPYHTIGRYLALPTGSIRAGQNSPYFDNYMREGKYGPGKYDFIVARLLFPNLFRRRLPSPISKHNNCASARKFIT
jgi:hypothetical protein